MLAATGDTASQLLETQPGERARVRATVSENKKKIGLSKGLGIVNGGPRLLRGGRPDITAYREGFVWLEDPAFWYRFGAFRHPRTMAGVTMGGRSCWSLSMGAGSTTALVPASKKKPGSCGRSGPSGP